MLLLVRGVDGNILPQHARTLLGIKVLLTVMWYLITKITVKGKKLIVQKKNTRNERQPPTWY